MALTTATITFDIANLVGVDFEVRYLKVWATTNVPGETVADTAGNQIRIGTGAATVNANGTGSLVVWKPGTGSSPASWQTTIHVSYPALDETGAGRRTVRDFGPFTITADADLADLVAEQEVPPEYASSLVAELTALRDETIAAAASGGGGGGTGAMPVASANSGTAYTVIAPSHGERRQKLTLTGNATLTLSGGTAAEVCAVQLHLIQDGTGSRTVTWPTNLDWGINGAPVLSSATGKTDQVYLTTDDAGASWQGALIGNGYSSPVAPSAPTGLIGTGTTGQVALAWTQGAANGAVVTQNKIYRSTAAGTETILATISAGTAYVDTAVTNGTTYYYKVSAVNAKGEGSLSSEANALAGGVTVIASDNFSRGDATATTPSDGLVGKVTPVGSKTWINPSAVGLWSNLSGKAVPGVANRKVGLDIGVSDFTYSVDVTYSGGAADDGIYFRKVDETNYCKVIIDPGGYYIQKMIAGSESNVASGGTPASAATVRLTIIAAGTSVTAKVDGVTVASGTIADAAVLTGTQVGLIAITTGVTFDNLSVTVP